MKILFVCHRLPFPPKRGGKIRPFNIIRHLTESGHQVTVGSLARSNAEMTDGLPLRDYCDKLLVAQISPAAAVARMIVRLPTTVPSSMGYFYSRSLRRQLRRELEQSDYDLIFVHCSSVAQYVLAGTGVPSILDFGDMDSQKWLDYSTYRRFPLSLGYRIEGTKLCREEKRLARMFSLSTCTTRAELETLRGFDAAPQSDWFPNGVDAEFFSPTDEPYDPDRICFIGRMDYYPNQQAMLNFCDDVFPRILERRPGAKLVIVGAEPSSKILSLMKRPGITVTGTVPDVRDYVRRSALSIAPLAIARGTQNKILESMAMGVPVVCSEIAAGGVDAVAEEHILTADGPSRLSEQVFRVLESADERSRLSTAARDRVVRRHNWSSSMKKLDQIIGRVTDAAK